MYLDFFSFERPPFRITPDPSLFYPGDEHGRGVVLEALIYGITSGEGILKVVGEVGSGKTMLCRMLEERLPDTVEVVYLANPSLTAREIVYAISFELKLDVTPETDRLIVMQKLQEYLLQKHSDGGTVVVFIEEAQGMPLETLEEIRLLTNLETHQYKLMQIILFGQPELDKLLQQKSIRQLRERITHNFDLAPLSLEATRDYLRFRLQAAGCPWPQLFSPHAEKMLASASSGLTRRINILADKSLLAAYADSSIRQEARDSKGRIQSMVHARHVRTAIKDCGYPVTTSLMRPIAIGVGLTVLILCGIFIVRQFWFTGEETSSVTLPQPPANVSSIGSVIIAEEPSAIPEAEVQPDFSPENNVVVIEEDAGVVIEIPEPEVSASLPNSAFISQEESVAVIEEVSPVPETATVEITSPIIPEVESQETTVQLSPVEIEDAEDLTEVLPDTQLSSGLPEPQGLIADRLQATLEWLKTIPNQGYTVQMLSVPVRQEFLLESFLESLESHDLLESTFICELSEGDAFTLNRLVFYGEFQGLSFARQFINGLPEDVTQGAPYVRNLNDISCLNVPM